VTDDEQRSSTQAGAATVLTAASEAGRFHLLAAVGEVADGTRLLGETVQRLLDIIVPAFADVATLDVISLTGEMRRLGARVEGPGGPEREQALLRRHQSGDTSVGVLKTVADGQSQLLVPVPDEALRAISTGEEDYELLHSLGLRATMYAPLTARGRTLGVLACSVCDPGRDFTAVDQRFAEALGSRIGLALDNAGLSESLTGLERRLEATLANLAAAVIVRDPDGRMVFANHAAAELLGAGSVEELFATTSEQLMARFDAYDEQGAQVALRDLPSSMAAHGERPPPMVVRSVNRASGKALWLLHKATPVFDDDGALSLAVNVIEDITREKRAELTQRLLAEAGRELSSSLDYEQTLRDVARLAVPDFADWCGVSIRGAGPTLQQVAVAHVDPERVALARDWGRRYPTRLSDQTGAAQVIRSGEPQLVPEITDDLLAASGANEEQLRLVRELGMRSVIIVPLAMPGRQPFGTLTLVMAESGRQFEAGDLAAAEELGRRAATAVENARLYSERSRVASVLQRSLLPPELPHVPGFEIATLYKPAGESSEVGGDFYDVFPTPAGWMVVVGDVTGHGAVAAALTSLSRYTLRTAARLLDDPVLAVEHLNGVLRERPELSLVSLACAVLSEADGAALAEVLLAGHPPPYHVHDGRATLVETQAQLLGLDDTGDWTTATVSLEPGDLLVLYTDGVIDTGGADERFGAQRLAEAVRGAEGAADAVRRIDSALSAFSEGPQRDDTAALVVQRLA
jgi:PAS domain S-box-containing protein